MNLRNIFSKMFSKTTAPISQQTYSVSSVSIKINRILGIFPLVLYKENDKLYLKWSSGYLLYSFILGFILHTLTYKGLLEDIFAKGEHSIKIKSTTDLYVVFCDVSTVQIVIFFSIFVNGFAYSKLFDYLKITNEVDLLLPPNNTKSLRSIAILVQCGVLGLTFSMFTADTFMYIKTTGNETGKTAIFKRYLPFFISYHVMLMSQIKFFQLASAMARRLNRLNQELVEETFTESKNGDSIFTIRNVCTTSQIAGEESIKNSVLVEGTQSHHIQNLGLAYGKLCESVNLLNKLLGGTTTVTLLDILWHLIETPYHLLSEISGRGDPTYITMMLLWLCYHSSRLLLLVEPCHYCKQEILKMNKLTYKLLHSDKISVNIKNQLKMFAFTLTQYKLEFTAAGFIKIDRSVITASVGTITTFLAILFDFRNK